MKMKVAQSCPALCDPMDYTVNSPGQNTGVGSCSLLQRIFPTQGLNPGLPHCSRTLSQPSHQGSPRILKCVVYSFCTGSSQPRNQTQFSCNAGGFSTSWAPGEAQWMWLSISRIYRRRWTYRVKISQNIHYV